MFKELQLTNFKSFAGEPQTIPFAPVTIFVGANGSGKSNVFDAIRFLQGVGMGLRFSEIFGGKWEGGRESHPGLRGGAAEVCWSSQQSFTIDLKSESSNEYRRSIAQKMGIHGQPVRFQPESRLLQHRLQCAVHPNPQIKNEELYSDVERTLFVSHGRSLEAFVYVTDEEPHAMDLQPIDGEGLGKLDLIDSAPFDLDRSLLTQFDTHEKVHRYIDIWSTALALLYREIRFQKIQPDEMKQHVPSQSPELGTLGENLSAVVYRICQNHDEKEQFLEWLGALCAPQVTDIAFDQTGLGDVMVQLVEGNGEGKTISARSLSDGTLRFIGYLAALFSAPKGSIILLEEIENGLHPTRVHLLVELFEQFAEARNIQIIATTHSSQVLLALSEQALQNAVLFAREEEFPGTITRRLGDLPDFEEVTQRTHVDRLFTTGWLERAL